MSIDARLQTYGKVFENWTIREKIGQGSGGKSAVFLLKRKNLTYEETCVMKVVNIIEQRGSYNETASSLRRDYGEVKRQLCNAAENEVSLMYELRGSGNIVNYLDYHFEEWEDRISFGVDLLIRMDYLSSLGNLIRTRTLSENEILRIGRDISNALMNCHARNIIHRDIKPDNIFYDQYGAYLLGDFGISRMLENSKRAETRTGTEPYAAPEQFAGGYDERVDIYSLGLTLYQLANENRLPFADSEFVKPGDIQRRLTGEDLPKPQKAGEALSRIIKKACAFRREDRYRTAAELKAALEALETREEEREERAVQRGSYDTIPALQSEGFKKNPGDKLAETIPALDKGETDKAAGRMPEPEEEHRKEVTAEPPGTEVRPEPKTREMPGTEPEADCVALVREYQEKGDFEKAVLWLKKGVALGNREAMYELALSYKDGKGVPKEDEVALNLLLNYLGKETDEWKSALAKFRIGQIYENGYGGKKGRKEAERWFRESAGQGNPYAMKKFRNGKLVKEKP